MMARTDGGYNCQAETKIGHVIHLNNLFRNVDSVSYKAMMNGKPQTLISKFKISYNLLLNLIDIGDNNLVNFAKKSMITGDLDNQMKQIYYEIENLFKKLEVDIKNISETKDLDQHSKTLS